MKPLAPADLLENLLSRYSPTLHEANAVQFLAGEMKSLGYTVQVDAAGSVRGSLGTGPAEIVMLGHIDTVPGEIHVHREGDFLFGRGAVDAKGPLACFVAAAALVGALPGWKITVIGAVGEEGDSRGAKLVGEDYAVRPPQFCIIGEPSGWDHLTLGYKGSAWMEYQIQKPLAHSAARAESACDAAVYFWNVLQAQKDALNAGRERAFDQLTLSLRHMQSSEDGFIETALLHFNLRLPPDLSPAKAHHLITQFAGDGVIRMTDGIECYRADKNNPLVRAFLAAIRAEGGKPGFLLKTGTSDMNIVGPKWNCPILAYGPGDSSLDHTPQEHILISELNSGVQVLARTLFALQDIGKNPSL